MKEAIEDQGYEVVAWVRDKSGWFSVRETGRFHL
jgi:hypothetical protein